MHFTITAVRLSFEPREYAELFYNDQDLFRAAIGMPGRKNFESKKISLPMARHFCQKYDCFLIRPITIKLHDPARAAINLGLITKIQYTTELAKALGLTAMGIHAWKRTEEDKILRNQTSRNLWDLLVRKGVVSPSQLEEQWEFEL